MMTVACGVLLVLTGCQKSETAELGIIAVTLEASSTYTGVAVDGVTVTLTNTSDQTTKTAVTDATGVALFEDLASSTYNATASVALTTAEALLYTGLESDITLSGSVNSISVSNGSYKSETITLDGSAGGSLVIKEVYCTGAANDSYSIMFRDIFIEVYNNSDEVQYVDGLYILDLGNSSYGSSPTSDVVFGYPVDEYVYANKAIQFPGNGTDYPVQPGQSVVVAFNAVNYVQEAANAGLTTAVTVDNSTADFDTYFVDWWLDNGGTGSTYFDVENSDVPTMLCSYHNNSGGFFNLSNCPAIALADIDDFPTDTYLDPSSSSTTVYYLKIPANTIIDGIEILANSSAAAYKRFNTTIDAGFYCIDYYEGNDATVTGAYYSGNSYRRKVSKVMADGRNVLCDTNNSTNDLEIVASPTPRCYNN